MNYNSGFKHSVVELNLTKNLVDRLNKDPVYLRLYYLVFSFTVDNNSWIDWIIFFEELFGQ